MKATGKARGIAAAGVLGLVLLGGPACESRVYDGGGWSAGGAVDCGEFASCASCTPVSGCGWCFDSNGMGECAPDPDSCSTPAFSWTWNLDGCRLPADAGPSVVTREAGPTGVVADAGAVTVDAELVSPPEVEVVPPDAGLDAHVDASFDGAAPPDVRVK